jgi:hypothetical protein
VVVTSAYRAIAGDGRLQWTDEAAPCLAPARDQRRRQQPHPDGTPPLDHEGPDEAVLIGEEFHLHVPDGVGRTEPMATLADRRLGVTSTGRNWRTVTRLLELSAG